MASFTSCNVTVEDAATFTSTPVAPWISSSRSGDRIASSAAARARFSPLARPIPINAEPASFMMLRTSAKSRLMIPGTVITSLTPWTAWRRTSSAILKESSIEVCRLTTLRSRSFGITMRVSTYLRSSSAAAWATAARRFPSNSNGLVTMPIVSAPRSLATFATTGAAPEPVPPPIPAVTKTRSEPSSALRRFSRSSCAARSPTAESPPAPRPREIASPMRMRVGAWDLTSACASVFTAMNSTPSSSARIMRFTALEPAPPTPTTRISAKFSVCEAIGLSLRLLPNVDRATGSPLLSRPPSRRLAEV